LPYESLSYDLHQDSLVHPALKKPEIRQKSHLNKEGYETYLITIENHSSTHVDAPAHFLKGGKTISDYQAEDMVFHHPMLVESFKKCDEDLKIRDLKKIAPESLKKADILLFKTSFHRYRKNNPEIYLKHNPGISPKLIAYLRENYHSLRALGIDSVSISGYQKPEIARKTHINAFIKKEEYGVPLLLIEDLNLKRLTFQSIIKRIIISPWRIKGIDSAPCEVLVEL